MQRNRGKQLNEKDQRSLQEIRDTKGTFHAKMGTVKEGNSMGLIEAGKKKKRRRGGKNRKNYTKEVLLIKITKMV